MQGCITKKFWNEDPKCFRISKDPSAIAISTAYPETEVPENGESQCWHTKEIEQIVMSKWSHGNSRTFFGENTD